MTADVGGEIEGFGLGAWEWDVRGNHVRLSRSLCLIYGMPRTDVTLPSLEDFLALVHAEDRARVGAAMELAVSEQLPRHEQRLRIVTADGRVRNVVRRARLVFDRHGVPLEFAGVDIDIGQADAGVAVTAGLPSQIKGFKLPVGVLAEKQPSPGISPGAILDAALREKEDVYRATLEALPAHIAVVARDGQIMAVNSAWSRFAENNQGSLPSVAVGANYLEVCRRAATAGDRDAARALGGIGDVLAGFWPQFTMEYPCDAPNQPRWFLMTVVPLRPSGGAAISHLDITQRRLSEDALRASEGRFRTIVNTAQEGIWAIDWEGRTTFVNPRLAELLDAPPESFKNVRLTDLCAEDDAEEVAARLATNLEGYPQEFECRFRRSDGTLVPVMAATAPLRDKVGAVVGVLGGFLDLTERQRADERQRVLMRELAHRGKNLLAVIQSIVAQTMAASETLTQAADAVDGRLQALARTYGRLTDEAFEGAPLDEIVTAELSSFGDSAHISGPKVMLTAKVAQTFALVVHELATNAAKYGALSSSTGRVDVSWAVSGAQSKRNLEFAWVESGGPPMSVPTHRGFGSTLVSQVAAAEFDCTPEIRYDRAGFSYRLVSPLAQLGAVLDASPVRRKLKSAMLRDFYDAWASLRGPRDQVPIFARFDRERFSAGGCLTIAECAPNGSVKLIEVGKALSERMGRAAADGDLMSEDPVSVAEAYRRCSHSGKPCYEQLRFDFGDGDPVTFERLLMPFSQGGRRITHVVGIAVFTGETQPRSKLGHFL